MRVSGSTIRPVRIVVGISGATGAQLAVRCLEVLGKAQVERHLVISPAGRRMMTHELPEVEPAEHADVVHRWGDLAAPIASGTFPVDAMLVVPCSARSLASIANGTGNNLLARAADVALKERRRLVLAVREMPLHLGHTRAMTTVTEMGAIVAPPVPQFYFRPRTVEEVVDDLAYRLVGLCGLEPPDAPQWPTGGRERQEVDGT